MTVMVFLCVLGSALLHAAWNVSLKHAGATQPNLAVIMIALAGACLGCVVLLFTDLPASESWPYVVVSGIVHTGYFWLLGAAYRSLDLSVAYPLMRGGAPLLTAVAGIFWFNEPLSFMNVLGIVTLSLGTFVLAGEALLRKGLNLKGLGLVVSMVSVIAFYTVLDGHGVRLSKSAAAYVAANFVVIGVLLLPFYLKPLMLVRGKMAYHAWGMAFAGAFMAQAAYVIVLWAMISTPVALVAALRETSVMFGVVLGGLFLKERLTFLRIFAVIIIVVGMMLLRIAS